VTYSQPPMGRQLRFVLWVDPFLVNYSKDRNGFFLFDFLQCFSSHKVVCCLIQVNNTDAEGRLTLADALIYAGHLKVDKVCPAHSFSHTSQGHNISP
jgi:hypothetical protein